MTEQLEQKRVKSWWDQPFKYSDQFIPIVMIIATFGLLGSGFFLIMSWNDIPTDTMILFDIDKYKEHLKSLRIELNDIDCDGLAKNLLSNVYSKEHGIMYSDYDIAKAEYGYKCLGEERPVYTTTSFSDENPRSKQR